MTRCSFTEDWHIRPAVRRIDYPPVLVVQFQICILLLNQTKPFCFLCIATSYLTDEILLVLRDRSEQDAFDKLLPAMVKEKEAPKQWI